MGRPLICPALSLAGPVFAQGADAGGGPTIPVTENGRVSTMPDTARISDRVSGEGRTPDVASQALADRQDGIVKALSGLLAGRTRLTISSVTVTEARNPACPVVD